MTTATVVICHRCGGTRVGTPGEYLRCYACQRMTAFKALCPQCQARPVGIGKALCFPCLRRAAKERG